MWIANGFLEPDAGSVASVAALLLVALLAVVLLTHWRERRRAREMARLAASLQQANAELQRVAYRDALTGLPNRVHFEERLREDAAAARTHGGRWAVLFVDLDGFAPVNDSFGHAVGDEVLREAGRRLRGLVDADAAARVGGDAFVLRVAGRHEEAAALARRVLAAMQQPFVVDRQAIHLSCSVGIALGPEHGDDARLITRAQAAMAATKRSGGAGCTLYTPVRHAAGRFDCPGLLADLREALARGELALRYQPKIDAGSGQVTAAEALLGWLHPTRGPVSPAVFLPIAERYGLIDAIGEWIVEDACRQARAWRDAGLRMRVAINLSALQLRDQTLVDRILAALRRHGVQPGQLTCEITESVAMSDAALARRSFERLGAAGIHVSIDDFGTGHSSLAYLRQLPVQELKIDRSFVTDLAHSADARAIVEAVLRMAHALGLKVVAEGVETERQHELLVQMGCDELQGYLYARPMPAEALTRWALGEAAANSTHAPLNFRASLYTAAELAEG
jgi:diguanylate cyclase (GGDEF)-like protein